jgi:predicted aspartyl protease
LAALIDTGADGTLVPESYLQNLIAYKSHTVLIHSHWGETRPVAVYVVDVEVAGHNLPAVEVVADDRGADILLGRNILNRLILLLDGPRNLTDVLTRRPTRL